MLRFYCFICIILFPVSVYGSLESISFFSVQDRANELVKNAIEQEMKNSDPKLRQYLGEVSAWLDGGFFARYKKASGNDYEVCNDDSTASFVERNHRREIFFCQRASVLSLDTLAQVLIHEVVHKVQYRINRFRTHIDECWAELISQVSAKDAGLIPWKNGYSNFCKNIYTEESRGQEEENERT